MQLNASKQGSVSAPFERKVIEISETYSCMFPLIEFSVLENIDTSINEIAFTTDINIDDFIFAIYSRVEKDFVEINATFCLRNSAGKIAMFTT